VNAYGVKAGCFIYSWINVWVGQEKLCDPLTRAIPECIRGGYDDALYRSTFTYYMDLVSIEL